MIELILGILIGGTVITALWIIDLKHIYRKNEKTSWEKWNRAQALTLRHANPPVPSTPKREQA